MNRSKDAEEHFLGDVEGFVAVAQQVDRQLNDHPLVLADQLGAGQLVFQCTALHQRRFASADIRPTGDPFLLQGRRSILPQTTAI